MKKFSNKIIVSAAAVSVVGVGLYGASQVLAAGTPVKPASLAAEISQAFHLDQSKVQAVLDTHKTEVKQYHEAQFDQRLAQAVTDGKLTAAQKDAIVAERAKLASELISAKAKPQGADRRSAIRQIRQEGVTWAKQNGIDAKWLMFGGHGLRRG